MHTFKKESFCKFLELSLDLNFSNVSNMDTLFGFQEHALCQHPLLILWVRRPFVVAWRLFGDIGRILSKHPLVTSSCFSQNCISCLGFDHPKDLSAGA